MSEINLIHFITSYGTRKSCKLDDLLHQYGTLNKSQLADDLRSLEAKGKIKVEGPEVWIQKEA